MFYWPQIVHAWQVREGSTMQNSGSGGIGAVSIGVSEAVVGLVILVIILVVLFGLWKLAKLLWAAFSN